MGELEVEDAGLVVNTDGVLRVGPPQLVGVTVDGEVVGDIGPLGTVRRNVLLDPQALKDGTAYTP